ncbi:phosphotransferase [Streptomyces sp. SBT349]|uniref:phosphotransferase n=1 Tax=Streptomyces sp. SBT349 TaxID=1580539 RepID=UPI00066D7063|nr:phosphotransferase [Streptomyces sp. SBT349]
MRTGELLGRGRDADVYALVGDRTRVLRRYRDGTHATGEAEVMAHLADHGYPVPAVHPGASPEPPDLVMERLEGPTLLHAALAGEVAAEEAGAILGDLLHRLHAVPGGIIHLDLHPDNVMLTPRGPMVIDWRNAERGPSGLDRAMSAVILAQAAVGDWPVAAPVLAALLPRLDDATADHLPEARARRAANRTMSPSEVADLEPAMDLIRGLRWPEAQISL